MKEKKQNIIFHVVENSKAWKAGIEAGDILLRVNDQDIEDIIEYMFLTSDEYVELEILKKNEENKKYSIYKEYDEDIGIVFSNPIIDKTKNCRNNCIFCFVDQLPTNLRKTLYFKDDDSRLSFLQGNFITLTNMSNNDIEKIIKYRISPINVSIHTTDPELRREMLKNKDAGNILERLKKLTKAGIEVKGQIVLCPDINDKIQLDKSIKDLSELFPYVSSLAVVPVGITKFREGLTLIRRFDPILATEVIDQIEGWQKSLMKKIGTRFVYLSDEFYVLANKIVPQLSEYEGFPQLENGVGLIREFENNFTKTLNDTRVSLEREKLITIVTGEAAYNFMVDISKRLVDKIAGLEINVVPIRNNFFGDSITVSGLITGRDIIDSLKNSPLGEAVFIPDSMLKAGEQIFLDDVKVNDIYHALNVPIVVCPVNGKEFVERIIKVIQ